MYKNCSSTFQWNISSQLFKTCWKNIKLVLSNWVRCFDNVIKYHVHLFGDGVLITLKITWSYLKLLDLTKLVTKGSLTEISTMLYMIWASLSASGMLSTSLRTETVTAVRTRDTCAFVINHWLKYAHIYLCHLGWLYIITSYPQMQGRRHYTVLLSSL